MSAPIFPRVRHIHIPDLPPLYAPRAVAPRLRHLAEQHILATRRMEKALNAQGLNAQNMQAGPGTTLAPPPAAPVDAQAEADAEYDAALHAAMYANPYTIHGTLPSPLPPIDLDYIGVPPTILSFTQRPTYTLPSGSRLLWHPRTMKEPLDVSYPTPPEWSRNPWLSRAVARENPHIDPLNHCWTDVQVLRNELGTLTYPMYEGPGVLTIWAVIDLRHRLHDRIENSKVRDYWLQLLEKATRYVLLKEYGIQGFRRRDSSLKTRAFEDIWVHPRLNKTRFDALDRIAKIANVRCDIDKGIVRGAVSIHVGQPGRRTEECDNPWTRFGAYRSVTSIADEMSAESIRRTKKFPLTRYMRYVWPANRRDQDHPMHEVYWTGRRDRAFAAPIGLDNYDIATAWAYEFAVALGFEDTGRLVQCRKKEPADPGGPDAYALSQRKVRKRNEYPDLVTPPPVPTHPPERFANPCNVCLRPDLPSKAELDEDAAVGPDGRALAWSKYVERVSEAMGWALDGAAQQPALDDDKPWDGDESPSSPVRRIGTPLRTWSQKISRRMRLMKKAPFT